MNKTIITGRLTTDADVNFYQDSTVINFTIANNDADYKDRTTGDWVERPLFIKCSYWTKSEKTVEYAKERLTKGRQVLIEGTLVLHEWTADSGEHKANLQLNIDRYEAF